MPRKSPSLGIESTSELHADSDNPRRISEEAEEGLRSSIERFGDLSGIVFNIRTGELVCGHQRVNQIRELYGDRDIEVTDKKMGIGRILVDDEKFFGVRVVDWSKSVQRAANVAANSQKISGRFDDNLSSYLMDVLEDFQEEMPGAADDLLLLELIDVDLEEEPKNSGVAEKYQVMVDCENEDQQQEVHELLIKKGWKCRVLIT